MSATQCCSLQPKAVRSDASLLCGCPGLAVSGVAQDDFMPVGAAGAIAGARRAKKRKQELERKQKQEQEKIEKWFKTFDTNHSGYLERDQLKALLTSLTPGGAEPEDGVLDGLMAKATPVDTTGDGVRARPFCSAFAPRRPTAVPWPRSARRKPTRKASTASSSRGSCRSGSST